MNENTNNCSCCGPCKAGRTSGDNPCKDCIMCDSPEGFCDSAVCMCESAIANRGE